MKPLSLILTAVLLMAGVACQQQPATLTEAQKAEIEKEVSEQFYKFFETVEKVDTAGFDQIISKNEFCGYRLMGHFDINSRQALMDTIKKFWSPVAKFGRGQLDVQIHVLAADLALVKDVATSSVFFKDGRTWEGKHHNTHLFRKEADGWKMIFWSQVQDIKQI